MLILNKMDSLKKEGASLNKEISEIAQKFKKKNRRIGREIYSHSVNALDTNCVRMVMNAIKETLITR